MNIFPCWAYNAWDIYQTIINFNSFDFASVHFGNNRLCLHWSDAEDLMLVLLC